MFTYTEWRGQSSYHKTGEVAFNEYYVTARKPLWLVALRMLGVAVMVAVAYGIALPTLGMMLPVWKAAVLLAGALLIYVGIAFFFRPEADGDNMGLAGGLANDPYQYSDNINRALWQLHCCLGPGRFTAETLLDVCVCLGLAGGDEVLDENAIAASSMTAEPAQPESPNWHRPPDLSAVLTARSAGPDPPTAEPVPERAIPTLSPDRFARRRQADG